MDTWQGPMSGWQELVGPWVFLVAFALLLLAAVTANALADTHPALGRARDAVVRAADRGARLVAPVVDAVYLRTAEVADRSLRAVRRVIDEQRSARRGPAATDAPADLPGPTPATS